MEEKNTSRNKVQPGANRMPADSVFYDKLVPLLIIALAVIMLALVLIAGGILLGIF